MEEDCDTSLLSTASEGKQLRAQHQVSFERLLSQITSFGSGEITITQQVKAMSTTIPSLTCPSEIGQQIRMASWRGPVTSPSRG